ncbi:MAG TPA: AIPR family protein [Fulvivirga sp.]|nr:AIPR family protein [Fulvivirga sp.]
MLKHKVNFNKRTDLNKYRDNALLLYSLQLKYGIEDIQSIAADSLVDGYNDKKTDLVYINEELGHAVIAQGYYTKKKKTEAPANKASDLNTAITWLLQEDIDKVPKQIKSAAKELRLHITSNSIKKISLWYSHNLPESSNVNKELKAAEKTLKSALDSNFKGNEIICSSLEVGENQLENWYQELTIPILVTDKIKVENCTAFKTSGSDWKAITSVIPATTIYDLYQTHKTHLFSANVRDYLGSRKSDSNINNGIKNTAEQEPKNFFVYNNGITALVNGFSYSPARKELKIDGISIVNGAQTTGAIGSLSNKPSKNLLIPIKFIKCSSPNTIAEIVKYNNSQNKINAPDFRSGDQHQKRITQEFCELGRIDYSSRRGGAVDVITRNNNSIPSITAGQVLAAFHVKPSIAYNDKSKIWDRDDLYHQFFNEETSAKHIFVAYTLVKSIEELKQELVAKGETRTSEEESILDYLRSRGSIILLASSIADSLEIILDKRVINRFDIKFIKNLKLNEAIFEWRKIVEIGSAFIPQLAEGLQDGIKNKDKVNAAISTFKSLISAVKTVNKRVFDDFSSNVKC